MSDIARIIALIFSTFMFGLAIVGMCMTTDSAGSGWAFLGLVAVLAVAQLIITILAPAARELSDDEIALKRARERQRWLEGR